MGLVRQTFNSNTNWTAPAGVFGIGIIAIPTMNQIAFNGTQGAAYIANDGYTYCWGYGGDGALGNGTSTTATSAPVAVLNSATLGFIQIIGNNLADSFYGINEAGDMYCWGAFSGLAVGGAAPFSSPTAVLGGLKFASVFSCAISSQGVYALTPAGAAYAWGQNASGGLGTNDVTARSSPAAVLGGLSFKQVATSFQGACFLTTAGAAYGCGLNGNGQLGDGTITSRSSPVAVVGGLTFSSIASDNTNPSGWSNYGLTAAGALYAWGYNANGQLGDGTVLARSSPVAVLGGLAFKQVACTSGAVVALTTAGALYAWGINTSGQLGVGDTNPRSSPVAVVGGLTFASVQSGATNFFAALTTAGALYAWGVNTNGNLGTNDVTNRSSPAAVVGGLTFTQFTMYQATGAMFGISNGVPYAWGVNSQGMLGTGVGTPASSPIAIAGGHIPNQAQIQVLKKFAVVPGTAYAVTPAANVSLFGTNQLGGPMSQIILEYEQ